MKNQSAAVAPKKDEEKIEENSRNEDIRPVEKIVSKNDKKDSKNEINQNKSDGKMNKKKREEVEKNTSANSKLVVARESGDNVFDYLYQVAATVDSAGANRLRDKLKSKGMDASVQKSEKNGKVLYRVHVSFRGTPDDTKKLRSALQKEGINQVILKTKSPVQ